MTEYDVQVSKEVNEYLNSLDEKSQRICRKNLKKLKKNPYPGKGKGDKEKLTVEGEECYRIHIGRTHTAFYIILEEEKTVRVAEILPIDKAHKKYGY